MDDILEYENLVWSIVSKYEYYCDKEDLYQVGMIGLLNAYSILMLVRALSFLLMLIRIYLEK